MKIVLFLILITGSVLSGAAVAGSSGDEFVGTWTSQQMVDTTLKIARTSSGFAVQETQQNTFGGAQSRSATAHVVRSGMLSVNGTSVYRYEEDGGRLVIMVAPNTFATFNRASL